MDQKITRGDRPALRDAWPAFAAGLAAFVGMRSCLATILPLTVFGAPFLGLLVTAATFALLLRFDQPAASRAAQHARLRVAAAVAWAVCIASGWRFGQGATAGQTGEASSYNSAITSAGLVGGAILGAAVAVVVMRVGMARYDGGTAPRA